MGLSFDGVNKIISLTPGTSNLGVRDLWSRWVDWLASADNARFLPAFTALGGDDIDAAAGTKIPIYLFMQNGWRIRPQEASHTLSVTDGILLVAGGGDPFIATVGAYQVGVRYSQPVQAISFATGGGGGVDPWTMQVPASYNPGTAGHRLGSLPTTAQVAAMLEGE